MSHRAPAALLALALSGCFLTYDANDVDRPPATAAPGTVALGDRCLLDGECGSGACAPEGICCDRACSGECEACNGVGTGQSAGNCGTLTAGAQPHAPHAACATDLSSCGGSCNGVAATCAYPLWQCRNQTCTGSTQENPASCDGAGRCPEASTTPCAPYACGGDGCRTGCVLDTACSPGNWCDASGSCVAKLDKGGACTAANQCRTGLACAPDGTCCDRACTGQCEACTGVNTGAAAGTCGAPSPRAIRRSPATPPALPTGPSHARAPATGRSPPLAPTRPPSAGRPPARRGRRPRRRLATAGAARWRSRWAARLSSAAPPPARRAARTTATASRATTASPRAASRRRRPA